MSYLHCDLTSTQIFNDGRAIDVGAAFPAVPTGVRAVRVLEDGTIERYSESDWAWKAAPELAGFVAQLQDAHATVVAAENAAIEAAAAAARIPVVR